MNETKQFKWAIELAAPSLDLDYATSLYQDNLEFSIGYIVGSDEKRILVLTSPQLDSLSQTVDVCQVAKRLLAVINGTIFLLESDRVPLKLAGIRERNADGKWTYHAIVEEIVFSRSRAFAHAVAIVDGKPSPEHHRPPVVLMWSAAAQLEDRVGDVLTYLSGEPGWFAYYKAFELMRDDINERIGGQRQDQMGWPVKKSLDHFQLSAHVYRHAPPWPSGYTPSTAMTLKEATEYIQSLARIWLEWRLNKDK